MKRSSSRPSSGTLVQSTLEPIAEQRAERLAAPHAVQQRERVARARARQVDVQRLAVGVAATMREPAAAQDAGGGRMRQAGRVDVSRRRRRRAARRARRPVRPRPGRVARCSPASRRRPMNRRLRAPPARMSRSRRDAADVNHASRRCEQQSSVSAQQQPPLVHRARSARSRRAPPRTAADQRERWKISPTSCMPTTSRSIDRGAARPLRPAAPCVAGAIDAKRVAVGEHARIEPADAAP